MKRFLLIFLVFILIPCLYVYGQVPMPVFDSVLETLLAASGIEQGLYYAQMVADTTSHK